MLYKKNFQEVLGRLTDFYERKDTTKVYAIMNIHNPALDKYSKTTQDGETTYPNPEERIKLWDEICKNYVDLEDDSLPICYLSEFDEGLYGGLVGGTVNFLNSKDTAWISSMTVPFVEKLSDALAMKLPDENNLWLKRYINQLKIYAGHAKDKFGISHFIMIDGLNFLFELRGATETYYDILEDEKTAIEVMEFAKKLNVLVQDLFFREIGLYQGGTFSNMLQWCPGKIVTESLDPFHLANHEFFEKYGKSYIEGIVEHYDGVAIHLHANGYFHLLEKASNIKGIKGICLIDDPYNPRAIENIHALAKLRNSTPLNVTIEYHELVQLLNEKKLPGNIIYNVLNVPSLNDANALMKRIKAYKEEL